MKKVLGTPPFPIGTIVKHKSMPEQEMVVIGTLFLKTADMFIERGEPRRWWQEEHRHDFKATCRSIVETKKKGIHVLENTFFVEELMS